MLSFGSLHLTHLRKCRCTGWKAQQTSLILFLVYVDFSFATLNGLTRLEVCYEYIRVRHPRSMCFSSCCPYQSLLWSQCRHSNSSKDQEPQMQVVALKHISPNEKVANPGFASLHEFMVLMKRRDMAKENWPSNFRLEQQLTKDTFRDVMPELRTLL